jgi:hypothetical protein
MAEFSFPFSPQPGSMLLQLPYAIRQRIIRLAVVDGSEDGDDIRPEVGWSWNEGSSRTSGCIEMEHPIMKTCKQLRHESAIFYFLENTFCLATDSTFGPSGAPRNLQADASELTAATFVRGFGPYASFVDFLALAYVIEYGSGWRS